MTAAESLTDALGRLHRPCTGTPRIVSLVPSLTELVCDLGLAGNLVGRTGFCVHPREMLRPISKVGGTKDVKVDAVRSLRPTHLIADIDENRKEQVEAMMDFVPEVVVVHPRRVDDNPGLYRLFGRIFRRDAEANQLVAAFHAARDALGTSVAGRPRETVLYPIWRDPWMTVSRDTYISSMLAAAGWDTVPEDTPQRFPAFDWDQPWVAGVQRVLLPSEPYAFKDDDVDDIRTRLDCPVQRIDGEMVSWYGSRAIQALQYLAALRICGLFLSLRR